MSAPHTLLATVGTSPQVITETLYALHHGRGQWPDEIVIITTSVGKAAAVEGLIEQGHLARLCTQLQRPMPAFDVERVLVVPGADGQPVEDARSLPDHEALANFIMTEVRNRTRHYAGSLHASLAGGRKTMTFYMGYAMSLFGRPQDSLSHVLVSAGYEGHRDFWFPTTEEPYRMLRTRLSAPDGQPVMLDANLAQVTLAPIPFVRHRKELPSVLLHEREEVNFAELVQLINLGDRREAIALEVNLLEQCLHVRDSKSQLHVTVKLGPLEFAFYTVLAQATVAGESDVQRPLKKPDTGLSGSLLDVLEEMQRLKGGRAVRPTPASGTPQPTLASRVQWLADCDDLNLKNDTQQALIKGVEHTWFDQRKNRILNALERHLPASLTRHLSPAIIWTEDGQRLYDSSMRVRGGSYGIPLQPEQISIVTS